MSHQKFSNEIFFPGIWDVNTSVSLHLKVKGEKKLSASSFEILGFISFLKMEWPSSTRLGTRDALLIIFKISD